MASPYDIVPGKIFLGGIAPTTNQDVIYKYFSSFGEIIDCVVMQDRTTGKSRGFGFITYRDSVVTNIILSQVHVIDGKEIDCKRAVPRDQKPEITKEEASLRTKKLFVGGLPQTANEEVFKGYFEQFGKIEDWVIMVDKVTGKSRGFGFITFESEESVELVISRYLENKIDGKWVECKKALPKDSQNNSQSSTTNASPAVSNYSSKKGSLNQKAGESDLEIVRSILAQQQGAKLSIDSEVENSQMSYLESKLQAVAKLSENKSNSFWDNLIQPDPSSKVWNEYQGEVDKGNYQIPPMYPYQQKQQQQQLLGGVSNMKPQPYNGSPYHPNFQQQAQQPQPRFMSSQDNSNPYMGAGFFDLNTEQNQEPVYTNNNDIYSSNTNKFIQPTSITKQEAGYFNYPPGLKSFDGNSYPANDQAPKKNSLTNQYQVDPNTQIKGMMQVPQQQQQQPQQQPQQQQQQQSAPQKKVEKYIPLYS